MFIALFGYSFSFLWGPLNHLKHLFSKERFWFTLSYITTLAATLYCSLVLLSTPLTLVCAVAQVSQWLLVSSTVLLFMSLYSSCLRLAFEIFPTERQKYVTVGPIPQTTERINPLSARNEFTRRPRITPKAINKHIRKRLLLPFYKC